MTENVKDFLKDIDELEKYRGFGTVEEVKKMIKEEYVLKFYYCESEDEYYIGKRIDTMYYAKYSKTGFVWCMSRYLPWGEHVVEPNTLWKEHTYPSEPKEIPFFDWLQGFIKKYCLGTVEECREARERQIPKIPNIWGDGYDNEGNMIYDMYDCPNCGKSYEMECEEYKYCPECGQHIKCGSGTEEPKTANMEHSGRYYEDDIFQKIISDLDRKIGTQLKIIASPKDEIYRYGYTKSLEAYQQAKLMIQISLEEYKGKQSDVHYGNGWIACEDRLPNGYCHCLVTRRNDYEYGYDTDVREDVWIELEGVWDWQSKHEGLIDNIIAWQSLPEPYRP